MTYARRARLAVMALALYIVLSVVPVASAQNAPLVVTSHEDSMTEEIPGSLRQAIEIANAQTGPDTIIISPDLGGGGYITLAGDLPPIEETLSIRGPGQRDLTIDGSMLYAGFDALSAPGNIRLRLYDLTIARVTTAVGARRLVLRDVTVHDSGLDRNPDGVPGIVVAAQFLDMRRSTIQFNTSASSSALYLEGNATILDSTFLYNRARYESGLTQAVGGAINKVGSGSLQIQRSTFQANTGYQVGTISVHGGSVVILNSTFASNFTENIEDTAVVYAVEQGDVDIYFSTFSNNYVDAGSGGVLRATGSGHIDLRGSVIANNAYPTPDECVGNVRGILNFSHDPACAQRAYMGIATGVDTSPRDNGGPTKTNALLPGSNVIDADTPRNYNGAVQTMCAAYRAQYPQLATDQRGIARPQFARCDLGAYESELLTLPLVDHAVNGGFESSGDSAGIPHAWEVRNLNANDYRRCTGEDLVFPSYSGNCMFMFRGPDANAQPRRLTQTLEGGDWSQAGDVLRLSAHVRTKNLTAGSRLTISVAYSDGTTALASTAIPTGTNPYQRLRVRLPLTQQADSVTVGVVVKTGGNAKTRLWVDNVILVGL